MAVTILGGIGLFLLGMVLLSDGLKAFAGDALRRALIRFTGRPGTGFLSGVVVTALVQSSSATTMITIGFVSAGMLSFAQAVGVLLGASLGSSSTGWIVSVAGLKLSLGTVALPVIGVGALLRLLGRGRWPHLGWALAGFGLMFVGIDYLQTGMERLSTVFNPAQVAFAGLGGRAILMLVGIAMAVVLQSSSAAVATTMTALQSGSLHFDQAAALVIGAAVGTTFTSVIAAIGASAAARRTALAHILFNAITGSLALLVLPGFLWMIEALHRQAGTEPGPMSLAAFHSAFLLLGVLLFLPFTGAFATWVERLVKERGSPLTRHLDRSLLTVPSVALEAVSRSLREIASALFRHLRDEAQGGAKAGGAREQVEEIRRSLDVVQEFIASVPATSADEAFRLSLLHALDHLTRLAERAWPGAGTRPEDAPALREARELCLRGLDGVLTGLTGEEAAGWTERVEQCHVALADYRRVQRPRLLSAAAEGRLSTEQSLRLLDGMRWLDNVCYHAWRLAHYLGGEPAAPAAEEK